MTNLPTGSPIGLEPKFKVGMRVKLIYWDMIAEITDILDNGWLVVSWDNETHWHPDWWLPATIPPSVIERIEIEAP